MKHFVRLILIAAVLALFVVPVSPASALPPCGGPWTGPMGTSCTFTVAGPTITVSGVGVGAPPTAVGITVFDPSGAYVGGCADYQPSLPVSVCNASFAAGAPGVYTCIVKGLSAGGYKCSD